MSLILRKADLDGFANKVKELPLGCASEDCVYRFSSPCHQGAGVRVTYHATTGLLDFCCNQCRTLIVQVVVAGTPGPVWNPEVDQVVCCGDCHWSGRISEIKHELEDVDDLTQRISPGEEVPAGECPKCGALCHLKRT